VIDLNRELKTKANVRIASSVLALMATAAGMAYAQEAPAKPMTRTERADAMQNAPVQTFHLKNNANPNDGNEILTGLRLMLDPSIKMYLVPSQNAIMIRALPDDLAMARKIIEELDRPRPTYRLTYTLTEMEDGKRVGAPRHFAVIVAAGQRVTLKAGDKVPIETGKYDISTTIGETQATYLDVGYNFDSTLSPVANGAQLKVKVERSHVAEQQNANWPRDPAIRQEVLEEVSTLTTGKPQTIGSLDVPDSTRHLDIEAMLEMMP
jgi:type II secretory pathway component GspD/PulD (secretin)